MLLYRYVRSWIAHTVVVVKEKCVIGLSQEDACDTLSILVRSGSLLSLSSKKERNPAPIRMAARRNEKRNKKLLLLLVLSLASSLIPFLHGKAWH